VRGLIAMLIVAGLTAPRSAAQDPAPDEPPFSLPFDGPAGPNTWLYEQHYGNTTPAFNFGDQWYASGQGLHFGVDFEAQCGTPVLAIADGVVAHVDAEGFGAGAAQPGAGPSWHGPASLRAFAEPAEPAARAGGSAAR
jgi:hypothetical protein